MHYHFKPKFEVAANFPGLVSIQDLENEVGVYSATLEFVRENCGPIANQILDHIPNWYYQKAKNLGLYVNIDVRIHRLYPGNYPAYPGWHCDGEYRETYFGQPDMFRIPVHNHLIATVSSHQGGVSNTQFLDEEFECDIEKADSEQTLWGQVHKLVESKGDHKLYDTKDGDLMSFDSWTLHRAMPTRIRGWRLFFRMSMWHKPNLDNQGKISKQEHIYVVNEGYGW